MSRAAPSQRQTSRYASQLDALAEMGCSDASALLEMGVEHGHFGAAIRERWPGCTLDGVDLWPDYISLCEERGSYDSLALADALKCPVAHDFLVAGEIIEHMEKDLGLRLLERLETLPRVGSVITTPIGFMRMGAIEGNPHQEHLSGWEPSEFEERGWSVVALNPGRRFGCYAFRVAQ